MQSCPSAPYVPTASLTQGAFELYFVYIMNPAPGGAGFSQRVKKVFDDFFDHASKPQKTSVYRNFLR